MAGCTAGVSSNGRGDAPSLLAGFEAAGSTGDCCPGSGVAGVPPGAACAPSEEAANADSIGLGSGCGLLG